MPVNNLTFFDNITIICYNYINKWGVNVQFDLVYYPDATKRDYISIIGFDNNYKLKDIVNFCSGYENYNDICMDLHNAGLIPVPTSTGVFKILERKGRNEEPKVYRREITYKRESIFYDLDYLSDYYMRNVKNPEFMNDLINKLYNYITGKCSLRTEARLNDIRFRLTENEINSLENDQPSLEMVMQDFVYSYCTKDNSKKQRVINFANLIILARYAINYERKKLQINPNTPDMPSFEDEYELIRQQIAHYKELIQNGVSYEEQLIYQQMIDKLEDSLPKKGGR